MPSRAVQQGIFEPFVFDSRVTGPDRDTKITLLVAEPSSEGSSQRRVHIDPLPLAEHGLVGVGLAARKS